MLITAFCGELPVAAAQSGTEVAAARRLFLQGVEAAREQAWEQARDAFARSFAIVQRPNTLLNLARAYENTGQLVEAVESYRRVAGGVDQEHVEARHVETARTALGRLEPRLARVQLHVLGSPTGTQLHLDSAEVAWAVAEVELEVNPGARVFRVTRNAEVVVSEEISVAEGESVALELDIPPEPAEVNLEVNPDQLDHSDPTGDSSSETDKGPNTGLIVGLSVAGAVAIAVAVVLAVVLSGNSNSGHQGDFGRAWEVP